MISKDLKPHIKAFLQTQKAKSDKTYRGYEIGLDPLVIFFEEYYDDQLDDTVRDIELGEIDHILGYFVIRKYMDGVDFRLHVARAIKAFFKYLSGLGVYDAAKAAEIAKIASHYSNQYPRIDKLETSLWDDVEGEIDRLMKLPQKEREAAIQRLRAKTEGAIMTEAGYVSVVRVDGNLIYGYLMENEDDEIGPIRISDKSLALLQVGDVINMITLQQLQGETVWEIIELGYVYPKLYYNTHHS